MGSGGSIAMVDILISDLVPLRQKAAFAQEVSWWRIFWILLPFTKLPGGCALISSTASDRDNCDREAPRSGLFGLPIVRRFIDLVLNQYLLPWFSISVG